MSSGDEDYDRRCASIEKGLSDRLPNATVQQRKNAFAGQRAEKRNRYSNISSEDEEYDPNKDAGFEEDVKEEFDSNPSDSDDSSYCSTCANGEGEPSFMEWASGFDKEKNMTKDIMVTESMSASRFEEDRNNVTGDILVEVPKGLPDFDIEETHKLIDLLDKRFILFPFRAETLKNIALEWMEQKRLPIKLALSWRSRGRVARNAVENVVFRIHSLERRQCFEVWATVNGNSRASLTRMVENQLPKIRAILGREHPDTVLHPYDRYFLEEYQN